MDLLWRPDTPTTASSTALQPVYTTYLWVVGAQLINGTELDQFLIDAEKGTEESMSRLCTGPIFLDGWNQNHQLQDNDKEMKPLNPRSLQTPHFCSAPSDRLQLGPGQGSQDDI